MGGRAKDYPITRPELPQGIRLLENVYLPMRDGVRIGHVPIMDVRSSRAVIV